MYSLVLLMTVSGTPHGPLLDRVRDRFGTVSTGCTGTYLPAPQVSVAPMQAAPPAQVSQAVMYAPVASGGCSGSVAGFAPVARHVAAAPFRGILKRIFGKIFNRGGTTGVEVSYTGGGSAGVDIATTPVSATPPVQYTRVCDPRTGQCYLVPVSLPGTRWEVPAPKN